MISISFILLGIVLLFLIVEAVMLRRSINAIAYRIHVNGTRGKSTVTRYIIAGLRAGGKRVIGKITGIKPMIFFPDNRVEIIKRKSPANIREQVLLARYARELSCDALVLECMSIAIPLQQIESKFLKPHITVLTNILDDHFEELGATDRQRTEAYCSGLPANSIIVTNDQEHIFEIEKTAAKRKSRVVVPETDEISSYGSALSPITAEHVRLALTACTMLGIEKLRALEGILQEVKNDESLLYEIPVNGYTIKFINGFAVNDVTSAKAFLDAWKQKLGGWENLVFVLNTRSDRPLRSLEFARWCSSVNNLKTVVLTGTHIPLMRRMLERYGLGGDRVTSWSGKHIQSPRNELHRIVSGGTVVFGFGNIAGDGFKLLDVLKEYRRLEKEQ